MKIISFLRNPPKRLVFIAALFSIFGLVFAGAYSWTRNHGHSATEAPRLGLHGIKAAYCEWKKDAASFFRTGHDAPEGGQLAGGATHYGAPGGYMLAAGPVPFSGPDGALGPEGEWSDIGPENGNDGPPSSFHRGGDFFSLSSPGGGSGGIGGGAGAGAGGGGTSHCKKPHQCSSSSLPDDGGLPSNDPGTAPITTPVPEPETYAMLLAGLGLMAATVRRRKRNA